MQAVIMTGGLGTRLWPLTKKIPKGLVEIKGRPFLEYLILYLKKYGIDDILLCTGYLGEQITEYFGDGSSLGIIINYSREDHPLGTGGALRPALPKLREEFFLLNGDTFLPMDYGRMLDVFRASSALMMVGIFPVGGTGLSPNLRVEGGRNITGSSAVSLSGELSHVDAGVRLARREIAGYFPAEEVFSLEDDLYPRLIGADELVAWPVEERFYDIGTPERLEIFENYLTHRNRP
jgi:NDP-sugar pyrophosphorylase family protein